MAAFYGKKRVTPSDSQLASTVLLLKTTETQNNNTFLDSSDNNFTISKDGNPVQGLVSPFSKSDGYWSNYFNGSGDYL